MRLENTARHADRIVDHHVVVLVERIALDHVRDEPVVLTLAVGFRVKGHGQARDALDGRGVDLGVGQHHLTDLVEAVQVLARQGHGDRRHLAARILFGLAYGRADRLDGEFHVLHAAVLNAHRGHFAKAKQRKRPAFGDFGDGHRDFLAADIKRGDG